MQNSNVVPETSFMLLYDTSATYHIGHYILACRYIGRALLETFSENVRYFISFMLSSCGTRTPVMTAKQSPRCAPATSDVTHKKP